MVEIGLSLQLALLERLRQVCRQDDRLEAAMLYGSFTRGEADRFSDVDVILYFDDEALAKVEPRAWLVQIAPLRLYYRNEFGNHAVVFQNLVRGEFHFDPASRIVELEKFEGEFWFPSLESTILVDRRGRLEQALQPLIGEPPPREDAKTVAYLCDSFLNWFLFGVNVLARGETARALEIMGLVQDNLLRLIRIQEGITNHWIAPTKSLEGEISSTAYRRFQGCTAHLERRALWDGYREAWAYGNELLRSLAQAYPVDLPEELIEDIGDHLLRSIRAASAGSLGGPA